MAESDLLHYYKVLKQFLDILDDSGFRAKSNSSRAQRAREKLLKLSLAQFRELSTDVYDELRRRIDELRSEPDFLLPKLTFHPKRNQARQKLSSLPQSRFKDLVSDISFEIERRNLHSPSHQPASLNGTNGLSNGVGGSSQSRSNSGRRSHTASSPKSASAAHSPKSPHETYRSPPNLNAESEHGQETFQPRATDEGAANSQGLQDELNTPLLAQVSQKSIGVQSSAVVPTKANLAWLSDESEGEADDHKNSHNTHNDSHFRRLSFGSFNSNHMELREETEKPLQKSHFYDDTKHTAALKAQNEELVKEYAALKDELDSLQKRNLDLQTEYASLEQTHAAVLAEKSLLQNQVDSHANIRRRLPDPEQYAQLQNELEQMKATVATLRLENQSLKSSAPQEPRTASRDFTNSVIFKEGESSPDSLRSSLNRDSAVLDVNSELKKLYLKIEELGSTKPISSKKEEALRTEISQWKTRFENAQAGKMAKALQNYKYPDLKTYVSTSGLVPLKTGTAFFASVESFLISISDQAVDRESLFNQISNIALLANKITCKGDNSVLFNNEYTQSVREAATYALTATRYHATYPMFLPKVIVERAVSEVAFTMCDYLSVSKLNLGAQVQADEKSVDAPVMSSDSVDEEIHFRPLKMASKLQSITNLERLKDSPKGIDEAPAKMTSDDDDKSESSEANVAPGDFEDALSESLPIAPSVQDTKAVQPKKLSLFERILNPKGLGYDSDEKTPVADTPSNKEAFEKINENAAPLSKSPKSITHSPQGITNTPASPKRSSIMDKFNQFESPPSSSGSANSALETPSISVKSANALFTNDSKTEDSSSLLSTTKEAKTPDASQTKALEPEKSNAPTRSRSIFQSLRERFINDKPAKEADLNPEMPEEPESDTHQSQLQENAKEILPETVLEETALAENVPSIKSTEKAVLKSPLSNKVDLNEASKSGGQPHKSVQPDSPTQVPTEPESPLPRQTEQKVESKPLSFNSVPANSPPFEAKKVSYSQEVNEASESEEVKEEEDEARQRQEYRKSMAAATFNFDLFDIDDPDNTLTQVLLYLEYQTVQVISTIQDLLSAIKKPDATRGDLRVNSKAISEVISQMTEATNTSMNQTRNHQLKEHGSWVVKSLEDCNHRMLVLCKPIAEKQDLDFADKNFKQRLAGISFDIAKCTKELVKTVEEASLKEDIELLHSRLNLSEQLT